MGEKAGCSGRRTTVGNSNLKMPSHQGAVVDILVAYATSYGAVSITEKFVLYPTPVSTGAPTNASSPDYYIYYYSHSNYTFNSSFPSESPSEVVTRSPTTAAPSKITFIPSTSSDSPTSAPSVAISLDNKIKSTQQNGLQSHLPKLGSSIVAISVLFALLIAIAAVVLGIIRFLSGGNESRPSATTQAPPLSASLSLSSSSSSSSSLSSSSLAASSAPALNHGLQYSNLPLEEDDYDEDENGKP